VTRTLLIRIRSGLPAMLNRPGANLHLFYCETLLIRMWDGGGSCSRH
jgi:hypothetical protein